MNYYNILGISENSSIEEIKKAYRKKAHEHHPDKGGSESLMKEINNAYHEITKRYKSPYRSKIYTEYSDTRPIRKCEKCGNNTYYSLCLECWIKIKKEEKRQRVHNIRSFMFCIDCKKSLYHRNFNTLFCDTKCLKRYYKKVGKIETHKSCTHNGKCINKEQARRLKGVDIQKIRNLKYKERIAIFTRLIGKKKAAWFDSKLINN